MNRIVAVLSIAIGLTGATTGFDAINPYTVANFQCLKSNGYSFFIGRVYRSNGEIDTTGIQNIKNAWSGGMTHVDAYIFPCMSSSCPSAKTQVKDAYNALKNAGAKFGQLWMDIETYAWPSNKATNQQFILDMVAEAKALGDNPGIYSNNNNWASIVGSSWTGVSKQALWWANYNGKASFDGFVPFGGWSKPNIHQYLGDAKGPCSVGNIDMNWY